MGYGLELVTPPADEPVDVAAAKEQLAIADAISYHDAHLESLIKAARVYVEGRTGLQLLLATYDLVLDRFPVGRTIYVPQPPLQSVTSIQYRDAAGQTQTLDAALYRVSTARQPGRIVRASSVSWPIVEDAADAVTIRYVCGHSTPADVPETIRRAILMIVAHWFTNREAVLTGTISKEIELAVSALLMQAKPGDDFTCYGLDGFGIE